MNKSDRFLGTGMALFLSAAFVLGCWLYAADSEPSEPKPVKLYRVVQKCGLDDWGCELGNAYAEGWRPGLSIGRKRANHKALANGPVENVLARRD